MAESDRLHFGLSVRIGHPSLRAIPRRKSDGLVTTQTFLHNYLLSLGLGPDMGSGRSRRIWLVSKPNDYESYGFRPCGFPATRSGWCRVRGKPLQLYRG